MLLPTPISIAVGLIFVVAGCAAIGLIFDASRWGHDPAKRDRVLRAHRIAGYTFVALFCLMTWFMILKVRDQQEELSTPSMFHVLVALVVAPLLVVKILIARPRRASVIVVIVPAAAGRAATIVMVVVPDKPTPVVTFQSRCGISFHSVLLQ